MKTRLIFAAMALALSLPLHAEQAPWGKAKLHDIEYKPTKVVYDVTARDKDELNGVLDRVSYLNNIYEANPFETSIVLVMHGNGIPLMAIENYEKNKEIVTRAQSLTVGDTITIKMCKVAAKGYGYDPEDIHGFIEMVPMADAEIVRLQHEGYAYMQ